MGNWKLIRPKKPNESTIFPARTANTIQMHIEKLHGIFYDISTAITLQKRVIRFI